MPAQSPVGYGQAKGRCHRGGTDKTWTGLGGAVAALAAPGMGSPCGRPVLPRSRPLSWPGAVPGRTDTLRNHYGSRVLLEPPQFLPGSFGGAVAALAAPGMGAPCTASDLRATMTAAESAVCSAGGEPAAQLAPGQLGTQAPGHSGEAGGRSRLLPLKHP